MTVLRFGDLPADMSELDYLGYGAFFPSEEPELVEMTRTRVLIRDPLSGATIDCRGVFDQDDLQRFLDSFVSSVELRGGAGELLFSWEGLHITMSQVLYASEATFLWEAILGGPDSVDGGNGADLLRGYSGDDTVAGGAGADTLEGGVGADLLRGDAGADDLDGGDGPDRLAGGADDDHLDGGAHADSLQGDAGRDVLDGGSDDDVLAGGDGDDSLAGGDGIDTATFAGRLADHVIDVTDPLTAVLGVTDLVLGEGTDALTGIETLRFGDRELTVHPPPVSIPVGAAFQLIDPQQSGRYDTDLATLEDGTVVMVWREYGGGSAAIRAQLFDASLAPLGQPVEVYASSSYGDYGAFGASVTALAHGGFAVAWTASFYGDLGEEVLGRMFSSAGAALSDAFAVNATTLNSQRMPQLAALPDGGFVAIWESLPGAMVGRLFDASGAPAGPEFVLPGSADGVSPEVAALADGGFVAVWDADQWVMPDEASAEGIAGQRYDVHGAPVGDRFALAANGGDASNPAVALLADGGFVIAWTSWEDPASGFYQRVVHAQRFDAQGAAAGAPILVAEPSMFISNAQPALTATDDGGFMLAWEARSIEARRFDAHGEPIGPADFAVGPVPGYDDATYEPASTLLPDGDVLVSWTTLSFQDARILAQRYDGDWAATRYTTIEATALADEIAAGRGAVRLTGGAGDDSLHGSPADDWLSGGDGNDWLPDGDGDDRLEGGAGRDRFDATPGDDTIDGGAGTDTLVVAGNRSRHALEGDGIHGTLTDTTGAFGTDRLEGIERLRFDDAGIAWDTDGIAGQAYRLYKAAFDRIPDPPGLGYWIRQLDDDARMLDVSSGFIGSAEFRGLYGEAPSNTAYARALYLNVLDREPDADGYAYWNAVLDGTPWHGIEVGRTSREQMLIDFAESPENKANVIDLIATGIDYVPWLL